MTVNASDLADELWSALGQSGSPSAEIIAFADGILDELTISGSAGTGSPTGNQVTGQTGPSLATRISAAYGSVSTELTGYATGLVNYEQAAITISYTDSPLYELMGIFAGMTGAAMAAAIATATGFPSVSSELLAKSTAIVDHIHNNATANLGVIS